MERALGYYQRFTDILSQIILTISAIVIGLDILSIFFEAVGRHIIGSSRAFMEELPRLLVPFIVFPMMGVLLKAKKHIAVAILPEHLKDKRRAILMIAVFSVVLAVATQFLIAGIIAVKYYYEMGFETHTEIIFKFWVTYLPFPVGFGLLILFAVELLWQELVTLLSLVREGAP